MFRLYRELERGEFIVVGGDCSQGGDDFNVCSFFSVNKLDFPLLYRANGVAANMTEDVFPILEWIYDQTGIRPEVAFERQMGGASEMERLKKLNKSNKYNIFIMPKIGTTDASDSKDTTKYGWDTNTATRPILIGDWKDTIDNKMITMPDEDFISEHKTFIVNKQGKPEASGSNHDDCVISPAICWQLYQRVPLRKPEQPFQQPVYQPNDDVIGI